MSYETIEILEDTADGPGVRIGAIARPRISVALHRLAFMSIVLLSAVLNLLYLNREGYANTYYAATVKSMLLSWHNFFFVSFDPGGFVAADKPPLGLWLQVGSARLFGFSGVSILLPQAIAGVLSVIVLYLLVSRIFGRAAGLIASLTLALTPVAVVDNRNNTSDSVLIFLLLLAGWAVTRAVETGRLRWLLLGAAFIGLGFNTKEFEAYLVLPALFLFYLVGAQRGRLVRIGHLIVTGIVTLITSFAWIVAVDLTPAGGRPYVSDSGTNSELSLALGYNGLGRLATGLLKPLSSIPILHVKIDGSIVPGISMDIGNPGLLRLILPEVGGQASWLLIVALIGLLLAFIWPHSPFSARGERAALVFWGAWLLAACWFFSVARFYHLYYLIMLAPPIAALTGIGLVRLWEDYRSSLEAAHPRPWQGWMLPVALVAGAWAQAHLLAGYTAWNTWLGPAITVICLLVAAMLALGRLGIRFALSEGHMLRLDARSTLAVTMAGILTLFAAPAAFASVTIADGNGAAWLPSAGPNIGFGFGPGPGRGFPGGFPGGTLTGFAPPGQSGFPAPPAGFNNPTKSGLPNRTGTRQGSPVSGGAAGFGRSGAGGGFPGGGFGGGGGALTFGGLNTPTINSGLISYLEKHRGSARYLVATETSSYASLFILQTGQPVMTLGGYQGWDKILTLTQLKHLVKNGTIRFFLLSNAGGFGGGGPGGPGLPNGVDSGLQNVNNGLTSWVSSACSAVPSTRYQTKSQSTTTSSAFQFGRGPGDQGPEHLYDCGGQ